MKLEMVTALLTAALAQATLVEPGLPNGVYEADASNITTTSAPNRPPGQADNLVSLSPRDSKITEETPIPPGNTFCHTEDDKLSLSDFQTAVTLLFESPLFLVPEKSVRYALYGNSVAYICNHSGVNTASLLEYMQAMGDIDAECGSLRAGKRVIPDWRKYYGRAVRGAPICGLEGGMKGSGGLANDLDEKIKAGCRSHVNGYMSIFRGWTDQSKCYDSNARQGRRRTILAMFPWYRHKPDEDHKVQMPYSYPVETNAIAFNPNEYRQEVVPQEVGNVKGQLIKTAHNWRA